MDTKKLEDKYSLEFPNLDAGLIYAIVGDCASEAECRETLQILSAEAESQPADWKELETRNLEEALKDVDEQFSAIEFRNGKLTFKADDEEEDTDDEDTDEKGDSSEEGDTGNTDETKSEIEIENNYTNANANTNITTITNENQNQNLSESDNVKDTDDWLSFSEDSNARNPKKKQKGRGKTSRTRRELAQLLHMFPKISHEKANAVLTQCDHDVERAAEELLSFEALEEFRREHQLEYHLEKLHLKNVPLEAKAQAKAKHKRDLQKYLAKDIQYLVKIYKLSPEKAWEYLEDNDYSLHTVIRVIDSASTSTAWQTVIAKPKSPTVSYAALASSSAPVHKTQTIRSANASSSRSTIRLSRLEVESQVALSETLQEENRMKAFMAYRKSKSNPLYRSVAGHYSAQAQIHNAEKHVALESRFNNIVRAQTTSHSMDLHGLPLQFAIESAQEKLHKWWSLETQRLKSIGERNSGHVYPLKLISGSGKHSAANIPKIKNGLRKKLHEGRWIFQEHDSFFVVTGVKP